MLDKINRLPAEIKLVDPLQFTSPFFLIKFKKSEYKENRFAFVISKKVSGLATSRNRLKRQFSECIRQLDSRIKKSFNFIIIVKQSALNKTTEEINQQIEITLKKAGLIQ